MPKTRYQAYIDEVNAADWLTDAVEPHGPVCLPTDASGASRRIMSVAVVDCLYWGIAGHSMNNISLNTYANFFVINPADPQGNIYLEYVETHQVNDKGSGLHRVVHLVK
jgi:hypothetical protein